MQLYYNRRKMSEDNDVIVLDYGSGLCKAGIAGEEEPSVIFPTLTGRPYTSLHMPDMGTSECYIGNKTQDKLDILSLEYPIERGIVTNWDDMEKIWHHTFYNELRVAPSERPILITKPPLNPKTNIEKTAQMMFEVFDTPGLYMATDSVLSMYASGRTTGVVFDAGDGVSHVVPIYEGYALPHAIKRLDLAGRDVTDYLQTTLQERGYCFASSAEHELARKMKEKLCYVAVDFQKESALASSTIKETYKLPDGQFVSIDKERFGCTEALFQPSLLGLNLPGCHTMLFDSIMLCETDIHRDMFVSIILTGGTTMLPGFGDRIRKEVRAKWRRDMKLMVHEYSERQYSAWIGGSILGSLSNYSQMFVTREEYMEQGPGYVHRRF